MFRAGMEVGMSHNKSMRIFLISLCILVVSGVLIIAVVGARAHKKELQQHSVVPEGAVERTRTGQGQNARVQENSSRNTETKTDSDSAIEAAPQEIQQTGSTIPPYRYELREENGFLEVYEYKTDRLFMHTGISSGVLSEDQLEELHAGKYFADEKELYGYLESCTS